MPPAPARRPPREAGFGAVGAMVAAMWVVEAIDALDHLRLDAGLVGLVAGLGTWLIAPAASVTFGASGVVIGYATYLIARGVFSRRLGQLAVGVAVGLLFGGALLSSLVPQAGISWQDHLFGGLGGLLAARLLSDARRAGRAAPPRLRPP